MVVVEGNTLGDGYLMRKDQANGVTRDHVAKCPQCLVAAKLSRFLPCWVTLVSKGRGKLLGRAIAVQARV